VEEEERERRAAAPASKSAPAPEPKGGDKDTANKGVEFERWAEHPANTWGLWN
jgi:hypothetical protein